ncbi:hypothetical protein BGZ76_000142 [Entomortierella beljakovae]|nr:hypothetical protein BGZ76_000142 [Entomortierella beljakovae]
MGKLVPFCFASEGRSIYAIAIASNYSRGASEVKRLVLVKTNPNPVSLAEISWSVISTVETSVLYDISNYKDQHYCIVDDLGVFTYMDINVFMTPTNLGSGGVQYSPSLPPNNANNTGSGGWRNIDVTRPYPWDKKTYISSFFLIKDAAGNNVITHAVVEDSFRYRAINFGTLNGTSLQAGPTWDFSLRDMGLTTIDYNDGIIHIGVNAGEDQEFMYFIGAPFTVPAISPTIPAAFTLYGNFTNITSSGPSLSYFNPVISGMYNGLFYFVHQVSTDSPTQKDVTESSHWLSVMRFTNTSGVAGTSVVYYMKLKDEIPSTINDTTYFEIFGGKGESPTLVFFQTTRKFTNETRLCALHLDGPSVGQWEYADYMVNVTDTIGIDPSPPVNGTLTPDPNQDTTSNPSTGLIVGLAVGLSALVCSIVFLLYSRRTRRKSPQTKE